MFHTCPTKQTSTFDITANCPAAVCNPAASAANNRLMGTTYDSAGNTTLSADSQQYVYDGENKMVAAKNSAGNVLGQYWYDGDGKRVKKYVPGTGETTIFVYDAAGKTVAEYSTQLSQSPQVAYLTSDTLGTPRINTNAAGAVISRHDYQPYGEEIAGAGARLQALGYAADDVRKQFTGYERDDESGLDFAEARMYEAKIGRFITVDPLMASGQSARPQSWNRYVYSYNSPLRFNDPTGMVPADYYDQEGNRIGTDGVNDGLTLVVTNAAEVQTIRTATANNQNVARNQVSSALEMLDLSVRRQIGVDAVAASNATTSTENGATGGFAETGGTVIQTANGQLAVPAVAGQMGDPRQQGAAAVINPENPADRALVNQTTQPNWVSTYHVHPSGEIRSRNGNVAAFEQTPSNFSERVNGQTVRRGDIPNAAINAVSGNDVTIGYRIVVGAGRETINGRANGGQRVYFYNGTGVLGSLPLNRFISINTPIRR